MAELFSLSIYAGRVCECDSRLQLYSAIPEVRGAADSFLTEVVKRLDGTGVYGEEGQEIIRRDVQLMYPNLAKAANTDPIEIPEDKELFIEKSPMVHFGLLGDSEAILKLIQAGGKFDYITPSGMTPLVLGCSIPYTARYGYKILDVIQKLEPFLT